IYYEDLGQTEALPSNLPAGLPDTKRKAFALLMDALLALRRENKEVIGSSMIKDTIKRKKPSFNESYHGYRSFSELLEDAQREGLRERGTDKRSRTYVVTRFGSEMKNKPVVAEVETEAKPRRRRRRSSSGRRREGEPRERKKAPAGAVEELPP